MRFFLAGTFMLLAGALGSAPAHAQATRTWVSGVGDDVNPCSRTAPCKTFAGAISKTADGGEINCLDPGGYGGVTITKSLIIACTPGWGGVLVAGTNAIVVNAQVSDVVVLKGLYIDGLGQTASPGLVGVSIISAAHVHIEDCVIQGFKAASSTSGNGIRVRNTNTLKFSVTRTSLIDNGAASTGGGIVVAPTSGAGVSGVIDNVTFARNTFGIAADGSFGAAGINIEVNNSTVSNSAQSGIVSVTNGPGVGVMVADTAVIANTTGLQVAGGAANIRVGTSRITANSTGVSGVVFSYGNNQLNGNGIDGSFSPVALQ